MVAYSLGVVVNSLLPVPLLPERAGVRRALARDRRLDRWATAHFGG